MTILLYCHLIAVCAWIGSGLFLLSIALFLHHNEHISSIYKILGPFYGYFATFWLIILLITGSLLLVGNNLPFLPSHNTLLETELSYKLTGIIFLIILTIIHTLLSVKNHHYPLSSSLRILSRISSLLIIMLNFMIAYFGLTLSHMLH